MKSLIFYFVSARAASILGDRVAGIVLPLAVLATTGSAATAGLVGAVAQLPPVLAALHVGALVDRRERRGLMVSADLLNALSWVGLAAEIVFGGARLVPLLLLALATGIGDAVFYTAAGSYLPHIAGDRDLMRANGIVEGSDAAATLMGPTVGGWLMQRFGSFVALMVNAGSFVVSAMLLQRLPQNQPRRGEEDEDASVLAGLRLIKWDRRQTVLLVGACYMNLLAAAAFLPLLARAEGTLALPPATIGLIMSAAGIGGLVSSFILARYCDVRRWPLMLAVVLAVNACSVGVLALLDAPAPLAITILILDGASALAFIVTGTIRQRITPDPLRGRVFAASSAVTATVRMVATGGIGGLIDLLGAERALMVLAMMGVPFLVVLLIAGSTASGATRIRTAGSLTADQSPP